MLKMLKMLKIKLKKELNYNKLFILYICLQIYLKVLIVNVIINVIKKARVHLNNTP
jgi:hypothetical protein